MGPITKLKKGYLRSKQQHLRGKKGSSLLNRSQKQGKVGLKGLPSIASRGGHEQSQAKTERRFWGGMSKGCFDHEKRGTKGILGLHTSRALRSRRKMHRLGSWPTPSEQKKKKVLSKGPLFSRGGVHSQWDITAGGGGGGRVFAATKIKRK